MARIPDDLARDLVEWAADGGQAWTVNDRRDIVCKFCDANVGAQDAHADDCLHVRAERALAELKRDGTCSWVYQDLHDYWQTGCGQSFVVTDSSPSDNDMRYCPYCGWYLVETRLESDPDGSRPGMRAVEVS